MKTVDLFSDFEIAFSERKDGSFRSAEAISTYLKKNKTSFHYLKLEHSDKVCETQNGRNEYIGDALVSRNNENILGMVVGDCFPVILINHQTKDIALIHCGWKSLAQNIVKLTLQQMNFKNNFDLSSFSAWIGPGISENAYRHQPPILQLHLPKWRPFIREADDQTYSIDLAGFIHHELITAGLVDDKIIFENRCTFTEQDSFFSHFRAKTEGDEDGRFFICIWPKN